MANTPYYTKAETRKQLLNQRLIYKDATYAKPQMPIVSFIADDCYDDNVQWYVPILDAKGVKGTFASITRQIGDPGRMTEAEIKSIIDNGHEVCSHTLTHPRIGDLPLADAEYELFRSKLDIKKLGSDSKMFVSPFGSKSIESDKIIRRYYKADFKTSLFHNTVAENTHGINYSPIDSYYLKRVSFDVTESDVLTIDFLKGVVDTLLSTGGWLIFTSHPQYPEYSNQARKDELGALIDYIQSLDIPILTAGQAFEIYKNQVEIGNTRLEDKYYALGMDGTEAGNYFD